MAHPKVDISRLTPQERLDLLEAIWDSLEAEEAAPMSPELAAELDRRSGQAEKDPEGGRDWDAVKADLKRHLK